MKIGSVAVSDVLLRVVWSIVVIATSIGCSNPTEPTAFATSEGADQIVSADLIAAETFIDAFYSWDEQALATSVSQASKDAPQVLYYQAWAEAGNYAIQTRRPCARAVDGRIECPITVTDDLGGALGYVATDTFHLDIQAGQIVGVEFTADDPPVFQAVFDWMSEDRPAVFTGPCKDMFTGGPTPAECVRAVVQGAQDYMALQ